MSKKKQEIAHPIDVLVGRKIREFRVRHDLSQKSLGDEIGLTFQQIQKYESGKNRVSASILFEIARVLKTPVGQFFNNSEQMFQNLPQPEFILSDSGEAKYVADDKAVLHFFMQIRDPRTREAVVHLLKSITESQQ